MFPRPAPADRSLGAQPSGTSDGANGGGSPAAAIVRPPAVSLPTGGGSLRSIDEKFGTNPVTGTASLSIPIAVSPGRSGFGPQLSLGYDSGSGNGPFGFGWSLSTPAITRKTDRGLPRYRDDQESDVFVLSGVEDLVRAYQRTEDGGWVRDAQGELVFEERDAGDHRVCSYRPRNEGSFTRIERWTRKSDGDTYWRTISGTNGTSFYGKDANSRIFDPADPTRVFAWLICSSYDDKGNALLYEYKAEDSARIFESPQGQVTPWANERNRDATSRSANRYLKRIRYGNRVPNRDAQGNAIDPTQIDDWMFEVVFDYGEGHLQSLPAVNGDEFVSVSLAEPPGGTWAPRQDAFSTHRSGFEVRTYRLCRRILLFHHFPQELGTADYLVQSTEFNYSESPVASFLTSVVQSGYIRQPQPGQEQRYLRKSLPPLEFEYSHPPSSDELSELPVEEVDLGAHVHLPIDSADVPYQWVDLDGEGVAGVLSEHESGWLYRRNLSATNFVGENGSARVVARIGPPELLASKPNTRIGGQGALFVDLAGDGQVDLIETAAAVPGFYERTSDADWASFRPFASWPNVNLDDSNLRFVDLDGDGRSDLLITDEQAFTWYSSMGEEGFAGGDQVVHALDEEKGPRLVFADGTLSIYLADFSGDGLTDLVRIQNGEVCYWPNLGYGRFGAKVTMDDAPWFAPADLFDQRRLRLVDIDGSGVTDLIYLDQDGARVYFNQSGNSWSAPTVLPQFPPVDNLTSAAAHDLLGSGTACLVWSSPLADQHATTLRYIDLMRGQKPHLLTRYENGMGKEVRAEYRPSTYYYLADREAGTPWVTKLPFPVHCVHRVTVEDHVRETLFTSTFAYHHGYYDGREREFRGFGCVDQIDTETFEHFKLNEAANVVEEPLHQPPVLTKTWFHTGACLTELQRILNQFAHEYYQNPELTEYRLPELPVPAGLDADEYLEAFRAYKGATLRQEVYALDGSAKQPHPFTTTQTNFRLELVQPRGANRHASFMLTPAETLVYYYERNPGDPRISHSLTLETDELGLVTKSAAVSYPRVAPDPSLPDAVAAEQARRRVVYSETDYTNDVVGDDVLRRRAAYEARSYELTGVVPPPTGFFTIEGLKTAATSAPTVAFEATPGPGPQKRLIGRSQTLFRADDLSGPLPLGTMESLGLDFESYALAMTDGLVQQRYGTANVTPALLTAAGYVHREGDADWWMPSGVSLFPPDAASHFYLPVGVRDPLGSETRVRYDAHDLLAEEIVDDLNNRVIAENDYRILAPWRVTDPNLNQTAVEMDALGVVVKTVVTGKAAGEGDTLADPTTRIEYDHFRWRNERKPNFLHVFSREQHGGANPRWQEQYIYADGAGSAIMMKSQAEPGIAKQWNEATGQVEEVDTTPALRWVATGRTIVNNKGNPVKRYEPYFSATHEFESARELVEVGVTPLMYYDALGRSVRVVAPDGTLSRVEFDTWSQRTFDPNDTVLESHWYADRGSPDPNGPEPADPEQRSAWLAAKHANTATVIHFDALGRTVYGVADNGGTDKRASRTMSDLTGHLVEVFDANDRLVSRAVTDMRGTAIYGESAEQGERWIVVDVVGNPVRIWDSHGRHFRVTYDVLHRPVSGFYRKDADPEIAFSHIVYGEAHPDALARNLRGRACQAFDQAGVVTLQQFDFKGNLTHLERRLAREYKQAIDWSAVVAAPDFATIQQVADPHLEAETFAGFSSFDALNRPVQITLPDSTIVEPSFNVGNILETLRAQIRGQGPFVTFLAEQEYDARGQRQFARFGNGTTTRYTYDQRSLRLTDLLTKRDGDADDQALQRLHYSYDPVGNITRVVDDAQQTHYFDNAVVKPESLFEYDALYQLLRATGREHAGLGTPTQRDHVEIPINALPHANNATAVRNYTELYEYDVLGNITKVQHTAHGAGGWTQHYRYAYQDDPADRTNRLTSTSLPGDPEAGPFSATYSYNATGHMTAMPHLPSIEWDFIDQLRTVDLGGGGKAYYVYGAGGQRLRKVIERNGGQRVERLYLGTVEITREWSNNTLRLERETVHVFDDVSRIAQVDTKTVDTNNADPAPLGVPVPRYQFSNHLGSAVLETNATGDPISYEEYHPYGTSAYRSSRPGENASLKLYRYIGKERDEESGLYYFGARYYAPWLGRWTSPDPAGFVDGPNLYRFSHNSPCVFVDPTGTNGKRKRQPGDLNPAGQVTWHTASAPIKSEADIAKVLPPDNPEHPYTPGTAKIERWVTRVDKATGKKYRVPIINAEWLDPQTKKPLLPRVGESGHVTSWGTQPKAEYSDPNNPSTRLTENEHGTPRAQQKLAGAENPDASSTPTTRSPRDVSLTKTRMDNQRTNALKQQVAQGRPIDYVDDVVMPSNRDFKTANRQHGSPIREGSIDRQTIEELNRRFSETPLKDVNKKIQDWEAQQGGGAGSGSPGPSSGTASGTPKGSFWGPRGFSGFASGVGSGLVRGLVPGFIEAEIAATLAPDILAYYGVTNPALVGLAEAAAAAPFATATVVVGSAVGGFFVGDFVEEKVTGWTDSRAAGVGAGTLAGAGTGAAIGAAVGSIVPGLGTAAGAIVGGAVGAIAGFIGSFW